MTNAIFKKWDFKTSVTGVAVNRNGDWVAVALGDGTVRMFAADDETAEPKVVTAHDGISLCLRADADAHGFISGGDDGRVVLIDPVTGDVTPLGAVAVAGSSPAQNAGERTAAPSRPNNNWIDHVAGSVEGLRAYTAGKKLVVLDEEGREKFAAALPSSAGGLAFSPNGKRLAVSHYNGVSLFWMNAKTTEPEVKSWKGSHLDLIWTPDGKSVLTSLQENALHGWQLADNKEMRMQGYAAKVRSMGFTARGKFLATSGADQIIGWPFSGGGPWGKPPLTLGGVDGRLVTCVAPHPKDDMVAAGYSDGMIVMAPLDGRMEIMVAPPGPGTSAAITGMVWNAVGDALYAATESGTVLLFTLNSVRKAVVENRQ